MSQPMQSAAQSHSHVFLGDRHEDNERKTWAVIILCGVMMFVEIGGGALFNSLALIADGLHMSTHAGAMLIAALAYTYARRHATDHRFVFGTGKLGDLAGFTSAIVLAVIALFIGYEAIERFISPVTISFTEAIPIAIVGLLVNVVSAWLLSGDHHGHSHGPGGHSHGGAKSAHAVADADAHDVSGGQSYTVAPVGARVPLFAQRGPHQHDHGDHDHGDHSHTHANDPVAGRDNSHGAHDGRRHASDAEVGHTHSHSNHGGPGHRHGDGDDHSHGHPHDHGAHLATPAQATIRDNSIRSAYVHVLADAFVSVLAITGLILAKLYGWVWMDPLAGIIGAVVIANWSVTLIRDTAGVLLDVCPDEITRERVRRAIENDGDQVVDLHLWRLGPGHLAAVVAIATSKSRDATFYRGRLASFACLSHITVEVTRADIS
jgi:cation diffusion facilitator family transporter